MPVPRAQWLSSLARTSTSERSDDWLECRAQYQKPRGWYIRQGSDTEGPESELGGPQPGPGSASRRGQVVDSQSTFSCVGLAPLRSRPQALAATVTRPSPLCALCSFLKKGNLNPPRQVTHSSRFCPSPQARSFPEVGEALCELSGVLGPWRGVGVVVGVVVVVSPESSGDTEQLGKSIADGGRTQRRMSQDPLLLRSSQQPGDVGQ